ncbi:MAG: glycoside hydrolase [Actinomycetota bacterium]|nr:glycoside hydrolase [Actinomycetota bacterium]MDQ6947798.1 glycoside hydrolase [Actinomycetota bacterium]
MKHSRVAVVVMAAMALVGSAPRSAEAAQPAFKQATFAPQAVRSTRLTAPFHMTKDLQNPVRAFAGPTSMLVDPGNPRIIVAATADLRTRVCQLVRSTDAGRTWHFSASLPAPPAYPSCMDNSAGLAAGAIAWGRKGTLYYAAEAFGQGEGGFSVGHVSEFLARSTDLGDHWTTTLVENNRGKPEPAAADYGAAVAVDASGPTDVVYVGFNQHYPKAAKDSPLNNGPVVVAVSTDGGATFAPSVDLNGFAHLTQTIAGTSYPLLMEGNFGAPLLFAHNGVVLAVTSAQPPFDNHPGRSNFDAAFGYAVPQLVARSTDHGKTWTVAKLGPPKFHGSGSQTGIGWAPTGGPQGSYVVAYQATPDGAASSGPGQIVVQRSTDGGQTWTDPVAINDDDPAKQFDSFYPQLGVAPNGRIDAVWQDNRDQSDFHFNVRYSYSTDGGVTWAPNMLISDRPVNFNLGVSYNSDLRQPPGVASANQYAAIGWADTRLANDNTQTQDDFGAAVQFATLPPAKNTVLPVLAAVFGGLLAAGVVLLALMFVRRRAQP